MLRLTDEFVPCTCPECNGRGRVPCPRTFSTRTANAVGPFPQPSDGKPIPCPTCRGAKIVPEIPPRTV